MKILQVILVGIFGLFLMVSCKKDSEQVITPVVNISGVYEGKFGTGNNNPSSFYSFNLKSDGTMQELKSDGDVIGAGSWTFDGNTFRAGYHYSFPATSFFTVVGSYDNATKKITGTWGYGNSDSDGGKWSMTKK